MTPRRRASSTRPEKRKVLEPNISVESIQQWFAEHVTLGGKPYTLDLDQARAVCDDHQNTLVTARAGSGKTRVIVAKVAYLVAKCHIKLDEIAIFMFNRTAAVEVNQRIGEVTVDGVDLAHFRDGGLRRRRVEKMLARSTLLLLLQLFINSLSTS